MKTGFPINSGDPDEFMGPRVLPVSGKVSASAPIAFDLFMEMALAQIDNIQCVFIDNSANTSALSVISSDIGMSIVCPPQSQGVFPFWGNTFSVIQISTVNTTATHVSVIFANIPQSYAVWATVLTASGGGGGTTPTNVAVTWDDAATNAVTWDDAGTNAILWQ